MHEKLAMDEFPDSEVIIAPYHFQDFKVHRCVQKKVNITSMINNFDSVVLRPKVQTMANK